MSRTSTQARESDALKTAQRNIDQRRPRRKDDRPLVERLEDYLQRIDSGDLNPYAEPYAVKTVKSRQGNREKQTSFIGDPELDRAKGEQFAYLVDRRGFRYAGCTDKTFLIERCGNQKQRQQASDVISRLDLFIENMPERLKSGSGGLFLCGVPGTGKDHLLMWVMREAIIRYGFSVHWIDGLEFLAMCKGNNFRNQDDLVEKCTSAQILAISDPVPPRADIGAYDLGLLRRITERRYSLSLSTWITTNLGTIDDAKQLLTSALLGRMLHGSEVFECNWESSREAWQSDG